MSIVIAEIKNKILPLTIYSTILIIISSLFTELTILNIILVISSSIYSLLNYFMIGCAVMVALEKSKESAKKYMILQYLIRYTITGTILYYLLKVDSVNIFLVIIPLFFIKIHLVTSAFYDYIRVDKKE